MDYNREMAPKDIKKTVILFRWGVKCGFTLNHFIIAHYIAKGTSHNRRMLR